MNIPTAQPLYDTFTRISLRFKQGRGAWLITDKGDRYLDFTSGIAVNALGHAHPHLVEALKDQADRLWHVSNLFDNPLQTKMAERLRSVSFADKVFFANYNQPECFRIITFQGAFHGRTLATLAAGGQKKHLEGFGPKVQGFTQIPVADATALLSAINQETAAIMIEPIQGEGGVRLVPVEILRFLRRICNEKGLLLIFDEVQSGIGRTGKLFAHEWAGVSPDIMGIAKGIGGGFPLGACLATKDAAKGMLPGSHGTTFGGNPLAMAVGHAVLDIILEPEFLSHVNRMAQMLKQGLSAIVDQYPHIVSSVEGLGLLTGLKCIMPNTEIISALRDEKLLAVEAGANVVRILPPLNILEDEMCEGLHRIEKTIARLAKKKCMKNSV